MLYPVKSRIRVYVVDQNDYSRDELCKFVRASPGLVMAGKTGSWDEAINQVPEIRPHVVIFHVLESAPGADIPVQQLREHYPRARLVGVVPPSEFETDLAGWADVVDRLVYRHDLDTGLLPAIHDNAVPRPDWGRLYS